MLQVVALDESTLEDRGVARPVLQLASAKKNPSTINHYNFPTLAWSPDRTAFAVVRSEVVDRKFRYTVSVFDTALQERYAQPVPMKHKSSYFFRPQDVQVHDDQMVYLAGIAVDAKDSYELYAVTKAGVALHVGEQWPGSGLLVRVFR